MHMCSIWEVLSAGRLRAPSNSCSGLLKIYSSFVLGGEVRGSSLLPARLKRCPEHSGLSSVPGRYLPGDRGRHKWYPGQGPDVLLHCQVFPAQHVTAFTLQIDESCWQA